MRLRVSSRTGPAASPPGSRLRSRSLALAGADTGGCLPVGHLQYIEYYPADTLTFSVPPDLIPPCPVDLTFTNNVPTTSIAQVPNWMLDRAGVK